MPAVAQKDGASSVSCTDGAQGSVCATKPTKWNWNSGITSSSDTGSGDVFVESIGAVRKDDTMTSHPDGSPCTPSPINHTPFLNSFSPNVYVNGRQVGRIGDTYNGGTGFGHTISSSQGTVFANG